MKRGVLFAAVAVLFLSVTLMAQGKAATFAYRQRLPSTANRAA